MKILFRPLLCSLMAFGAGCATPQPQPAPPAAVSAPPAAASAKPAPAPLLLISIDGYRTDYIERGLSPTLASLAKQGVRAADGMQPSFPSLTFPNHYTIVTGLRPDHHGIINNTMSDPMLGKFSLSDPVTRFLPTFCVEPSAATTRAFFMSVRKIAEVSTRRRSSTSHLVPSSRLRLSCGFRLRMAALMPSAPSPPSVPGGVGEVPEAP